MRLSQVKGFIGCLYWRTSIALGLALASGYFTGYLITTGDGRELGHPFIAAAGFLLISIVTLCFDLGRLSNEGPKSVTLTLWAAWLIFTACGFGLYLLRVGGLFSL